MKKIIENRILQLCCILVTLLLVACEEKDDMAPVITEVRNYAPSPDDSLVQSIQPGQWVVLTGRNLSGVTQIFFNGVSTDFNSSLFSNTYAVVQVPEVIPFPLVSAETLNTIQYVTDQGSTIFSLDISAPAPTITSIANENANVGEIVYVYGTNLFLLTKLTYAGTEITEYSSSSDGTYVSFILPELNGSGPVVVENKTGGYSTGFNVNDATGVICNFDDVNTMGWGTGTDDNSTNFPGNKGKYARLQHNGLAAGKKNWWELGINTQDDIEWIPAKDTSTATLDNYAVKFEINVPKKWEGTTFFIVRGYDWTYLARFEPWKIDDDETAPVSTGGHWRTVTIPFTQFLTKEDDKDGTGVAASSIREFFHGNFKDNKKAFNMWAMNDSDNDASALDVAVDNIRVVKIK